MITPLQPVAVWVRRHGSCCYQEADIFNGGKANEQYSQTVRWLRSCMSFSLATSAIRCVQGSRVVRRIEALAPVCLVGAEYRCTVSGEARVVQHIHAYIRVLFIRAYARIQFFLDLK